MKALSPLDQPHMGFQIAPMIDVVFVIMLFFMVMAGAMKTERYLPAQLPGIPELNHIKLPDVEILLGVHEDGSVTLNLRKTKFSSPLRRNRRRASSAWWMR